MRKPSLLLRRLSKDRRGATVVEYGLIVAGIVLAIFGAIQSVGGVTGNMWNNISARVLSAR
mgnify:CR=1 FL=1